jgi:hypothetical protein
MLLACLRVLPGDGCSYFFSEVGIYARCFLLDKEFLHDYPLEELVTKLSKATTLVEIADVWFSGLNSYDFKPLSGALCDRVFRIFTNHD